VMGPIPGKPDEYHSTGNYVGYGAEAEDGKFNATRWEFHHSDYQVTASSNLPVAGEVTYGAENLQDMDRETAWVDGAKGDGVGESVTLTLKEPAKVTRVGLVNGYAKSKDMYQKNSRAAELAVSVNDGEPFTVTIPDEFLQQEEFFFDLPKQDADVKTVKLTIQKVNRGSKYEDTAISELTLVVPLEKAPKIQPAR